jgi:hypothetical protein
MLFFIIVEENRLKVCRALLDCSYKNPGGEGEGDRRIEEYPGPALQTDFGPPS